MLNLSYLVYFKMCKIILLAIVIGVVASQSLFDRKKAVHDDIKRNAVNILET